MGLSREADEGEEEVQLDVFSIQDCSCHHHQSMCSVIGQTVKKPALAGPLSWSSLLGSPLLLPAPACRARSLAPHLARTRAHVCTQVPCPCVKVKCWQRFGKLNAHKHLLNRHDMAETFRACLGLVYTCYTERLAGPGGEPVRLETLVRIILIVTAGHR